MIAFLMTIKDEKTRSKLEKIYDTYHRDMYITAYSILKDHHESQDIVQEAIIRVSKNLYKISDIKCKKTRAYLVIIVRNLSYNAYNRRKGIVMLEHEEINRLPDDETLIEEDFIKMEMSREIIKHLKQTHPSYADILTLRYYYELEIKEISIILDITENNVSVRIHRALRTLKIIMEKEGMNYERTV
jgi:RNA polymerase sigma-70 factor (ECF subfamily)